MYKTGLGHFYLKLEQELSQFDTKLIVTMYKAKLHIYVYEPYMEAINFTAYYF